MANKGIVAKKFEIHSYRLVISLVLTTYKWKFYSLFQINNICFPKRYLANVIWQPWIHGAFLWNDQHWMCDSAVITADAEWLHQFFYCLLFLISSFMNVKVMKHQFELRLSCYIYKFPLFFPRWISELMYFDLFFIKISFLERNCIEIGSDIIRMTATYLKCNSFLCKYYLS